MVRRIPDFMDLAALVAAAIFAGHGAVAVVDAPRMAPDADAVEAERTATFVEIQAMINEAEGNLAEIERYAATSMAAEATEPATP